MRRSGVRSSSSPPQSSQGLVLQGLFLLRPAHFDVALRVLVQERPQMYPERAASWLPTSNSGHSQHPPALATGDRQPTPAWRPRAPASHLSRLVIPERVRRLRPDLPREIRRPTKSTSRIHELLDRRSWKSKAEAGTALFTWIEGWYKPRRRHSALEQLSPIDFERKHAEQDQDRAREPGLPTASVGSSQAPTAAVDSPAPEQSSA